MGMEQGGYIEEDYYSDGGGYAPADGGDSFAIDFGSLDSMPLPKGETINFDLGSGGLPPDYAQGFGSGDDGFLDFWGNDPWLSAYDHYTQLGFDDFDAADLADSAIASGGAFQIGTEPGYSSLPTPPQDYLSFIPTSQWQGPGVFNDFWNNVIDDTGTPPAPGACNTITGLPPACPQGQYHPVNDPCSCVPFPPSNQQGNQQQQQQKPPTQSGSGSSGQKPVQQQPSCPAYCRHPQTGQWTQTPAGYGCHPQTKVCTPIAQAQQQQPQAICPTGEILDLTTGLCVQPSGTTDDVLNSLKSIPWWIWAALGGAYLLTRGSHDERTTTVRYRRAGQ